MTEINEARQGGLTTLKIQTTARTNIMNIENDPLKYGLPRRAHHSQSTDRSVNQHYEHRKGFFQAEAAKAGPPQSEEQTTT